MKNTRNLILRPLAFAILGSTLAACGSSGSSGADNNNSGAGVTVGNEKKDFSGDIKYVSTNDRFSLELENIKDHTESWTLAYIKPEVGTYPCDNNAGGTPGEDSPAMILKSSGQLAGSSAFGGDCVIKVTQADSLGFSGVFSGTIVESGSPDAARYNVNDGGFEVLFANVIPDADKDGLSDADDNCPFDSNTDQADQNSDGIGDVCTVEEEA